MENFHLKSWHLKINVNYISRKSAGKPPIKTFTKHLRHIFSATMNFTSLTVWNVNLVWIFSSPRVCQVWQEELFIVAALIAGGVARSSTESEVKSWQKVARFVMSRELWNAYINSLESNSLCGTWSECAEAYTNFSTH